MLPKDSAPPPDHEEFERLRAWGNRGVREHMESRRKSPVEQLEQEITRFWAESAETERGRRFAHWCGKDRDRWLDLGKAHLGMYTELCTHRMRLLNMARMVEWGVGGGSNAATFLPYFDDVYGVDISQANLDECARRVDSPNGFHSVLIELDKPEAVQIEPCDFFLSTAVYQHFPGKAYGLRITKIAHRLLKPNGLAIIQIRYGRSTNGVKYSDGFLSFTTYETDEFWRLARGCGFKVLHMILKPEHHYAYYFLQRAA